MLWAPMHECKDGIKFGAKIHHINRPEEKNTLSVSFSKTSKREVAHLFPSRQNSGYFLKFIRSVLGLYLKITFPWRIVGDNKGKTGKLAKCWCWSRSSSQSSKTRKEIRDNRKKGQSETSLLSSDGSLLINLEGVTSIGSLLGISGWWLILR